jgi:hypothetical protein
MDKLRLEASATSHGSLRRGFRSTGVRIGDRIRTRIPE